MKRLLVMLAVLVPLSFFVAGCAERVPKPPSQEALESKKRITEESEKGKAAGRAETRPLEKR